jgi:hypothetical protein
MVVVVSSSVARVKLKKKKKNAVISQEGIVKCMQSVLRAVDFMRE